MTESFDVWIILDRIMIIAGAASLIYGCVQFISFTFRRQKILQIADASYIRSKTGIRAYIKQYSRFQPPIIIERNNHNAQLNYKSFVRKIVDEPLVFIFGESGSGKTVLLQHMACSLRRTVFHPNRDSLFGVFAKPQQTLDEFLISIKEEISSLRANKIYILLDGFDELREINHGMNASDLLAKVRGLFDNHFPGKTFCLIMSSRIEVFNQISRPEELGFSIYQIQKLSNIQVVNLYKKYAGSLTDASFIDQNLIRYKNTHRLKTFLGYNKKCKNEISSTIFCIPFVVQYVDILFSLSSDIELRNANLYEIYHKIIHDFWLEHEYNAYSKTVVDVAKRIPKDLYKQRSKEFIQSIIAIIYKQKLTVVTYNDIPFPIEPYIDRQCLISRNLLVMIDTGIYAFIHHSVYEFFIAEFMANTVINYTISSYYLSSTNQETILQLFCGAIYANKNLLKEILLSICNSEDTSYTNWYELFMLKKIVVSENLQCITIDKLILYFPNLQTLECGDFVLSDSKLLDFKTNRALDFQGKHLSEFSNLKRFGSIDQLNLDNCGIKSLEAVPLQSHYKRLSICRNPLASYDELAGCTIKQLRVTLNTRLQVDNVLSIAHFDILIFDAIRVCNIYSYILDIREQYGTEIIPMQAIDISSSRLIEFIRSKRCSLQDIRAAYILERFYFPQANHSSLDWVIFTASFNHLNDQGFIDYVDNSDAIINRDHNLLVAVNQSFERLRRPNEYPIDKITDKFEQRFWLLTNEQMDRDVLSIILYILSRKHESYSPSTVMLSMLYYVHCIKFYLKRKEYIKACYSYLMCNPLDNENKNEETSDGCITPAMAIRMIERERNRSLREMFLEEIKDDHLNYTIHDLLGLFKERGVEINYSVSSQ